MLCAKLNQDPPFPSTTKSKNLKCPAGYRWRSKWDGHNPFGSDDWSTKTTKEITGGCCEKLNKCNLELRKKGISCDGYGRSPWGECTLLSAQHTLI